MQVASLNQLAGIEHFARAAFRLRPVGRKKGRKMSSNGKVVISVLNTTENLSGELTVPEKAVGVVLMCNGCSGNANHPHQDAIAREFRRAKLGTLLLNLLTPGEAQNPLKVYAIELLAERVRAAVDWLKQEARAKKLPIGLWGAETCAAAALKTAAIDPQRIVAVVCCGGRPDLARSSLARVQAPTLLLVGSRDYIGLAQNKKHLAYFKGKRQLQTIDDAANLFESAAAVNEASRLSRDWFREHFSAK